MRRTQFKSRTRKAVAAPRRNRAKLYAARQNFAATPAYAPPVYKSAFVKGAIAPYGGRKELKYNDIASTGYVADTTGTVTALNLIAVGDDNTTRDGRQVTIKSVQLKGILKPVDGSTLTSKCRLLLVWDNAVNSGAIATVAQILTASTSIAFPLVDNAQRFTILRDMTFALGHDNTTTGFEVASPSAYDIEVYLKINQLTQYSGTTAAIGSVQNGALLMVTIGDQAAAAGGIFQLASRVRFCDL